MEVENPHVVFVAVVVVVVVVDVAAAAAAAAAFDDNHDFHHGWNQTLDHDQLWQAY